jgi:hypothetical protein
MQSSLPSSSWSKLNVGFSAQKTSEIQGFKKVARKLSTWAIMLPSVSSGFSKSWARSESVKKSGVKPAQAASVTQVRLPIQSERSA